MQFGMSKRVRNETQNTRHTRLLLVEKKTRIQTIQRTTRLT